MAEDFILVASIAVLNVHFTTVTNGFSTLMPGFNGQQLTAR
ncbi:hypothetical protein [Pedobacter alluvionis]|nr:hypothetical protein [Pedobacter alluvionis]